MNFQSEKYFLSQQFLLLGRQKDEVDEVRVRGWPMTVASSQPMPRNVESGRGHECRMATDCYSDVILTVT